MGYTTEFTGKFELNRVLDSKHAEYLRKFASTRRMARHEALLTGIEDEVRQAAELPVGYEGAYFVGATGSYGQDRDAALIDYNRAPQGQPGLWCQWVPNEANTAIEWDGGEKFYCYTEWLEYVIKHFLGPWGYILNGTVYWCGEDRDDNGRISVTNNVVTAKRGRIVYDY